VERRKRAGPKRCCSLLTDRKKFKNEQAEEKNPYYKPLLLLSNPDVCGRPVESTQFTPDDFVAKGSGTRSIQGPAGRGRTAAVTDNILVERHMENRSNMRRCIFVLTAMVGKAGKIRLWPDSSWRYANVRPHSSFGRQKTPNESYSQIQPCSFPPGFTIVRADICSNKSPPTSIQGAVWPVPCSCGANGSRSIQGKGRQESSPVAKLPISIAPKHQVKSWLAISWFAR